MADNHHDMMENRLIGCDVLPSHIHLTASSLAGLHIQERFAGTRLYIMPYGKDNEFDACAREYREAKEKAAKIKATARDLEKKARSLGDPRKRATLNEKIKDMRRQARTIMTEAAPKNPVNHVKCGSLELLDFTQTHVDAFDIAAGSILAASGGYEDSAVTAMDIRHGSCDMVVMNPPFSSAANPEQKSDNVRNPAFAGFNADAATQEAMSNRCAAIADGRITGGTIKRRTKKSVQREKITAGGKLPVYFAHIADTMLREGGTLALVLPLAFAQGESWSPLRQKVLRDYDDILLVSAAAFEAVESSFSSDTGIGEVVLVARKAPRSGTRKRVTSAILKQTPRDPLVAAEIGRRLHFMLGNPPPDILDGSGARPVRIGDAEEASATSTIVDADDDPSFRINSILDLSLAVAATRLRTGILRTGLAGPHVAIPMTTMDKIGEGGLLARDIDGTETLAGGRPRGPFTFMTDTTRIEYPAVHCHDKDAQSSMRVECDGYYVPKENADADQVKRAWANSGRVIIATHWRFNTQPCVVGYVDSGVLGGSTFPNFNLYCRDHEKAFAVWQNSILGSLCFWFHSTRQQIGRGIVSKDLRKSMPVLNFAALDTHKIRSLERLFDQYADKPFCSLDKLEEDSDRKEMSKEMLRVLLGGKNIGAACKALDNICSALSSEPTIVGKPQK